MKFLGIFCLSLFAFFLFAAPAWASFEDFQIPEDYNDGWYVLFESDARNSYNKWHGLSLDKISDVENPTPVFVRYWHTFTNKIYKNNFYDYQQGDKILTAFAARPYIESIPADPKLTSIEDEIFPIRYKLIRKFCNGNILSCVAGKFSRKFPFDILFNLPSVQITCPKVEFFGSEFDLCFIYEAMRLMKYPITAALIVKLFVYL